MSPMAAFLLFMIPSTFAHISMQFPVPRDTKNGVPYATWEQNEPMIGVHPTICHGLDADATIRDENKFNVGDSIQIDLYGTAVHDGGHCSFWYSTDDETFTKIIDVKDCTLDGAEVILPDTMPTACNDRCTFAWTWSPRVSQACEIYMNCADIQVSGSLGHDETQNPVSINFQTSFIDQGPSDPEDPIIEHYGCVRVDEVSHWTPIFGEIDTNYDYTDNEYEHNVVTNPDNTNGNTNDNTNGNTVCYSNPSMAINLDAEIDTDGQCGSGANDYRCDDGSCCSQYGYCGVTDGFCNANSVGDWRVTSCDGSSSTSTPTTTTAGTTAAGTTASGTTTPTTTSAATSSATTPSTTARFVSYIGQAGPTWGNPANNEEFLKVIGVPGYGGSRGYNYLNFAFWISTSTNGGAAVNGAAFEWQNILNRITSTSLKIELTGSATPTADDLRAAIKSLYNNAGIKIFISAFGGADHPMENGADPAQTATDLAEYANLYLYDGVDVDWEEAISGKFQSGAGGEVWLCALTDNLRNALPSDKEISHAPQSPYFMGSTLNQYPDGGYATVHQNCGDNIDFYNVQFYNQGGSTYNTYDSLFVSSIGWSQNSAVYQIMDGASPESVTIPASKLVVGKHTNGDGSSFIDGASLKTIFNSALADGRWSAGFMTWQFYKEIYPSSGTPLIDEVITANWPTDATDTTATPTSTTTPTTTATASTASSTTTPTTTATASTAASTTSASSTAGPSSTTTPTTSTDNIQIINHHGVNEWYFAANVNGISNGFALNKFEIQKANNQWFECGQCADSSLLYTCILDSEIALPVSVRLSAVHSDGSQHIITSQNFISTFDYGEISDFGSNFAASSTTSPTTTSAATSSTDSTQSGNPQQITLTNRASSGVWWYAVTPSDPITSIEMRGSGQPDWEMGVLNEEWAGDYYTFNQNINGQYQLPLSFRVTTLDGTVIIANDVIDSFDEGVSATIDVSGNAPFQFKDGKANGSGSVFGFYSFVTIVAVIVVGLIIAVIVWRRRKSKAQVSIDQEIEIEIENSVVIDPEMGIQMKQIDGSKTTELR